MKKVLITGVTRGLGYAITEQLLNRGDISVIGVSRSEPDSKMLSHPLFTFLKVDLADTMKIGPVIRGWANLSSVENTEIIFINNAGAINPIGFESADHEEVLQSIAVNLSAPILIYQYLVGVFKKIHLVNISSGAAHRPIIGWEMYCTTKAGMNMFARVIESKYEQRGINIDPGVIDTSMQAHLRAIDKEKFPDVDKFIDLAREGKLKSPIEAAESIIYQLHNENIL